MRRPSHTSHVFPYTTLFRSHARVRRQLEDAAGLVPREGREERARLSRIDGAHLDRRGARLIHPGQPGARSEEHTSELQSRVDAVCRHLLEKKRIRSYETAGG